MLERILIPLDGSEHSTSILGQLRRLLKSPASSVILLHVLPSQVDPADNEAASALAREYLEKTSRELEKDGVQVEVAVEEGRAADAILEQASSLSATLLAMATHGRTGWGRAIRGSVAERVLRRAMAPLFLVRPAGLAEEPGPEVLDIRRILVPMDGSEFSAQILPLVESLSKVYGSEVVLQHANLETPWTPFEPRPIQPDYTIGEEALAPYRERLESAGVECRIRIDRHLPAQAILRAVSQERADLLAMTTHGRSGPSRWVFGSVAETVLRQANCPLIVQRTGG